MIRFIDITGQTFGRLYVIKRMENKKIGKKGVYTQWLCRCDCGKFIVALGTNLRASYTKSCGCLQIDTMKARKKYNIYDLSKNFGIGYASNTNKQFYFDLEDYDKIKNYCWLENNLGYISTNNSIGLHRIIMNLLNKKGYLIDHINAKKYDNRKENLRFANCSTNGMNRNKNKNNKTGAKGVRLRKNSYQARIVKNRKEICIGSFNNLQDAINARKQKEIELFGEFAYKETE